MKSRHLLISGASGLVGQALLPELRAQGYSVLRLVRSSPSAADEVFWDPARGVLDLSTAQVGGPIEAVVHLAGENIAGGRWTAGRKAAILNSRVEGTRALVAAMARMNPVPRVLASASAVGFYGDRADEVLTENSPGGRGFLADVCRAWEGELAPAAAAGIRTVALRFGTVLAADGGALAKMLRPFRLGLGGPLGDGRQWMSWIAIDDLVGIVTHVLADEHCRGPVNVVAPAPVTNREFTERLASVLKRPAVARVPAAVLRLALGELADEALLASTRAVPARLEQGGYVFRHPTLEDALRALVAG